MKIRIATRKSALARTQAEYIARELFTHAGVESEFHYVSTSGDRDKNRALWDSVTVGVFTREVEAALHSGAADIAVHSLKDLPIESRDLIVAAIPIREDPRDVFISKKSPTLLTLPANARIATSSPRRAAFTKRLRPDLEVVSIRGNVESRIRKLDEGVADGIILAMAGLHRLGIDRDFEPLNLELFPSAPGQGALAVQARTAEIAEIVKCLDHLDTRRAVTAERSVLTAMGGGCQLALGAIAFKTESSWRIIAAADLENRFRAVDFVGPDLEALAQKAIEGLK